MNAMNKSGMFVGVVQSAAKILGIHIVATLLDSSYLLSPFTIRTVLFLSKAESTLFLFQPISEWIIMKKNFLSVTWAEYRGFRTVHCWMRRWTESSRKTGQTYSLRLSPWLVLCSKHVQSYLKTTYFDVFRTKLITAVTCWVTVSLLRLQ